MSIYKGAASEGNRAESLLKMREMEREMMNAKKAKMEQETERATDINSRFSSTTDGKLQQKYKDSTYGLLTLEETKALRLAMEAEREQEIAASLSVPEAAKKKKKENAKPVISFSVDDGEDSGGSEEEAPRKIAKKNPLVDTSFLPDRNREQKEREERERLRIEWVEHQKALKEEKIAITYSYWDGTGHRYTVEMKKGETIEKFLVSCLNQLRKEFAELRAVSPENLIYVKEDLIIPYHMTFYDFIVTKARGKSGPLFSFDVHDDVRFDAIDTRIEKDESHAGKVILRSWYERNKHIFPANRWEPYDPEKKWDTYTISDFNKN